MKIILGPLLGLESESDYTICFLTSKLIKTALVRVDDREVSAKEVGADAIAGKFWRAEVSASVSSKAKTITYSITLDGQTAADSHQRNSWAFYVPGNEESPRFAFASCNGFSSSDLETKTDDPYYLWTKIVMEHDKKPFSLLLMGGDQLYADEIWSKVSTLGKWNKLSRKEKIKRKFSKIMKKQVERFYENQYRESWSQAQMSLMFASIPSLMIWDDHDIFDGWGSYPEDLQSCDVFQGIFKVARVYFTLFQIRSTFNASLLSSRGDHFAFAITFRGYHILALDHRTQRTRFRIMDFETQWRDMIQFLDDPETKGELLVLSAVPVVYRDFSLTEDVFDVTPWTEELTDDLIDHWRSREHEGERARLIMRLLESTRKRGKRTVLLSGDIHIGCLGVINDGRDGIKCKIHQVVSSGIVHPAPSRLQWLGIMAATNDHIEYLNEDSTISISMLRPFNSSQYIRARNFVTIEKGIDEKLWINWVCDTKDKPAYPLA